MVMWILSDRTLPRSLRMMEGFGVHSFQLINAAGDSTFVKFHRRPKLRLQSTIRDEAMKIAGADPDFHRRDLFKSIEKGDFPEWELAVQLFTHEQAAKFPFDHLDLTKLIPEELVPLKVIGRMVLDRWPDNFFAETEQVAYCPANLVPGIDFSNDPLLQGRLFSYLDTQLLRLGSPNFNQILINAPKCPFANFQRDGKMQAMQPKGSVSYEPSSLTQDAPRESPAIGFHRASASEGGKKGRVRAESFADHYSQARQFYRSQTGYEQAHIASALVFELSKVAHVPVRQAIVAHLRHIEESLAKRIANALALEKMPSAPAVAASVQDRELSPALQIIGKMKSTLDGRVIGILVSDGSNGAVIDEVRKAATEAGAKVKIVAPKGGAKLANGSLLEADGQLESMPSVLFDAIAVILSDEGVRGRTATSESVEQRVVARKSRTSAMRASSFMASLYVNRGE